MRASLYALLVALTFWPGMASSAVAQVGRAAIGGMVGVGGGAVITISVVVARARFQNQYLESLDDLIHWQSAPMLLTPAVGVMFGLAGREALEGSVIGSTSGMLIGAAVGTGVGWIVSSQAEAPWAGGVVGAGVGMTIGGLIMGIRGWRQGEADDSADSDEPLRLGIRLPL